MSNLLVRRRAGLIHRARQVNDAAGGRLTAEDRGTIARIDRDIDKIETRMMPRPTLTLPEDTGDSEQRSLFDRWYRFGASRMTPAEVRALAADGDPAGGYLVPPEQTAEAVVKFVDDNLPIRQLATKFTVSGAQSLGCPSIDSDADDGDWTVELTTGTEDSGLKFGKRELQPWPVIKRIRVTNKLLKRAKNAEGLVNSRLAFKLLLTFEKAYLTGNGAHRPLGVFTASSQGISTSRDVSTGNTSSAIGADGLANALYSLKEGYLRSPSLRWLFHRDAVKAIRLLKGSTSGDYLFEASETYGEPDMILGVPVMLSEYAPNTFSTGRYVGLIGDFSYYYIADADSYGIQRLNELYAETDQTAFIARMESDGAPVLEEAFARVTLA